MESGLTEPGYNGERVAGRGLIAFSGLWVFWMSDTCGVALGWRITPLWGHRRGWSAIGVRPFVPPVRELSPSRDAVIANGMASCHSDSK